jgi:hypothetical protein
VRGATLLGGCCKLVRREHRDVAVCHRDQKAGGSRCVGEVVHTLREGGGRTEGLLGGTASQYRSRGCGRPRASNTASFTAPY